MKRTWRACINVSAIVCGAIALIALAPIAAGEEVVLRPTPLQQGAVGPTGSESVDRSPPVTLTSDGTPKWVQFLSDGPETGAPDEFARPFSFRIAPYFWLAGVNGDFTVRGIPFSVDKSFTQIVDKADSVFGLFARVDLRYDRLGFYVDGGYTRMRFSTGFTTPVGSGTAFSTVNMGITDFAFNFRLLGGVSAAGRDTGYAVDVLLGGRYMYLGSHVSLANGIAVQAARGWIDPIGGVEGYVNLGEHFRISLHGDVGAATSTLTWSGAGTVSYLFGIGRVEGSVFLGYKAISEEYSSGSGSNRLSWNTILHGPVIGVGFTF